MQAALGKPQAVISEEALAERNEKLKRSRDMVEISNGNPFAGKYMSSEELELAIARDETVGKCYSASH